MSWLPSNYSLNSIKDQFTNLAGELLNEIRDDKDNPNGEHSSNSVLNHESTTPESGGPSRLESKVISDLKCQIQCLQNEKKDLISSLEQLDTDNQEHVEELVKYKDHLQADLQKSKIDFESLKKEYDKLKDWSATPENDTECSDKCEEISKQKNELEQQVLLLEKTCDNFNVENKRVHDENELLKHKIEEISKNLQDQFISQDDYKKLEAILSGYEQRVRNYEAELEELQRSTLNSNDDKKAEVESVQNIVESSNKIIESKNTTIRELEEANFELKSKLESYESDLIKIEEAKESSNDVVEKKILGLETELQKMKADQEDHLSTKEELKSCMEKIKNVDGLKKSNSELEQRNLDFEKEVQELEADKKIVEDKMILMQKENLEHLPSLQQLKDQNQNYLNVFEKLYNKCFDSKDHFNNLDEITSKYEIFINFLIDSKSNLSKLQHEVNQLSDKNQKSLQEIDKLARNSSTLKQEIVSKNIEFEEFEVEYNELLKSNDLMLAELNSLKSNNLLSISETNEDNMLQLESDLENANTKIKELEVILDSEKSRPQSNEPFEMLQKSFDEVSVENRDLQKSLDKFKLEFENLDYKYNEQKAQIDSLQEELTHKDKQMIYLEEENNTLTSKLQELGDAYQRMSDDFMQVKTESLHDVKYLAEKLQGAKMVETSLKLLNDQQAKQILELKNSSMIVTDLQTKLDNANALNEEISKHVGSLIEEKEKLDCEIIRFKEQLESGESVEQKDQSSNPEKTELLEKQLANLNSNREDLIAALNSKHEESMNYYKDIQKLQSLFYVESEKCRKYELEISQLQVQCGSIEDAQQSLMKLTDQNEFLKDKCNKMTETLMGEQSSSKKQLMDANEREQTLSKELERLRQHLLQVEEMYTKELLVAEQKTSDMQSKVNEVEQREKNSSNVYTSVSIRANQQVETLQTQLQLVTHQRDEIRNKLSDGEDQINKQAAALTNLQLVLQQFQKDKQKDIHNETDRIRRKINTEKAVQADLQKEITNLKQQLQESKEGLQAAARLTDQLEEATSSSFNFNNELVKLRAKLHETESKYAEMTSQPDAKVDKMLVRNLIIGFISSNNNLNKDQQQILKIIGTVLDFSQQDTDKLQMHKNLQHGWLNSILQPGQNMSQESLSLAFVKFLENESKPMILPSLLDSKATDKSPQSSSASGTASKPTSILNEMVLPTFNDYGLRSSSSILKDVLK